MPKPKPKPKKSSAQATNGHRKVTPRPPAAKPAPKVRRRENRAALPPPEPSAPPPALPPPQPYAPPQGELVRDDPMASIAPLFDKPEDNVRVPQGVLDHIQVYRARQTAEGIAASYLGQVRPNATMETLRDLYGGGTFKLVGHNKKVICINFVTIEGPEKIAGGNTYNQIIENNSGILTLSTDPHTAAVLAAFQLMMVSERQSHQIVLDKMTETLLVLKDVIVDRDGKDRTNKLFTAMDARTETLQKEVDKLREDERNGIQKRIDLAIKEKGGEEQMTPKDWIKLAGDIPELLEKVPQLQKLLSAVGKALFEGGPGDAPLGPGVGPAPSLRTG